jgi:hypothetical protein
MSADAAAALAPGPGRPGSARAHKTVPGYSPTHSPEALRNPELGEARHGFVSARREPFRQALARAADKGELPADLDYELTMDLLIGPVVNRALATGGPLDPALAERIVDVVFAGLRATDSSDVGSPARPERSGP